MSTQTFELRGRRFELSPAMVEQKLKNIEPKAASKYIVQVNGRPYPPKQILAEATGKSLSSFTTMDAIRILSKLGFEVRGQDEPVTTRTISEQLFEAYLSTSGLTNFIFEPEQFGTLKRPDYLLRVLNTEILFELKQFDATAADFSLAGGWYDPYRLIREKIDSARKKFKDLSSRCCCLVLYNNNKPLVDLGWQFIYAAMLGNLGIQMPVNTLTGVSDETRLQQVFHGGGKMFRYLDGQELAPQNTTISAVLVLEQLGVGMKRFENAIKHKEKALGRKLELLEFWDELERARGTGMDYFSLTQLRVIVHENPFARIQLPRELFRGPYDERYAGANGRIQRLFCGHQFQQLEKEASEVELANSQPEE